MGIETDRKGPGRKSAGIAPAPSFPEKFSPTYETKMSPAQPGLKGQLRFEEGIATDTAVPDDFMQGMGDGYITPPGRPNHNSNVYEKPAQQTMGERAHLGSAAWTESPEFLGAFASGSAEPPVNYPQINRSGGRYSRMNPALVTD